MNNSDQIAVCSRSFSRNQQLKTELCSQFANVKFNDAGESLSGERLVKFLKDKNKAIVGLEVFSESVISRLPDLERISKYGVGLDMIDLEAMRKFGKRVAWSPGVNKRSVAELTLCLALSLSRNLPSAYENVRNGKWQQTVGQDISGKTVGIVGCGNIGQELVQLLRPFGCKILANDVQSYGTFFRTYGVMQVSLDYLLKEADVVTLHVPLNHSTKNIIGKRELGLMKRSAFLINTARGGLVDDDALIEFIEVGRIGGAALDVLEEEPPRKMVFQNRTQVIVTPHIGGSSEESILAMGRSAIHGLGEFANFII